jgi:serine/threonine-protein kinase
MAGERLPGYVEVRGLGAGSTGFVVLATSEATGEPVAVKYLSEWLVADYRFSVRFPAEARLLTELSNPNACRLLQYVAEANAVVTEYVPGGSLRTLLRRSRGGLGIEAALTVFQASLYGLAAAHAVGVIHRAYKASNVLVGLSGEIRLVDFGITPPRGGRLDSADAGYIAPELHAGAPPTAASDVYAATAGFVEAVTGRPLHVAGGVIAPQPRHDGRPGPFDGVPASLHGLLLDGLAGDHERRPRPAALVGRCEGGPSLPGRRASPRASRLAFPRGSGGYASTAAPADVRGTRSDAAESPDGQLLRSRAQCRALSPYVNDQISISADETT